MNPFSFLGNIGGAIGGGAKQVGGMFAKGFKKLGELDGQPDGGGLSRPQMPTLGPGGTGGFAGNQGLPQIGGMARGAEDARAIPLGGQRTDSLSPVQRLFATEKSTYRPSPVDRLINRPEPIQNTLPQLQRPDMPTLEPITDSASVSANLPMGQAEAPSLAGQMIAPRPIPSVRPPDFLGRKGATMDDTPLNRERYAYDNQYMENGHHPRRWQDIAMTALHGANQGFQATGDWRGALGGAGVGAAGAAINPLMARDFRFNQEQLPRIEASRKELERGQDRSFEMQKRDADLRGSRARTQATIAGMKDADIERRKAESAIALNQARQQAAAMGQAKFVDVVGDDGQVHTIRVNNDGTLDLGESGRAAMNTQRIQSREGIVDKQIGSREKIVGITQKGAMDRVRAQQGGANYRAGLSQSGQNARQKERLGAQYGDPQSSGVGEYGPAVPPAVGSVPVKRASVADVNEYAKQRGISPAEARAKFEAKGYRVE